MRRKGDVEDHGFLVFDAEEVDQVLVGRDDTSEGIDELEQLRSKELVGLHVFYLDSHTAEQHVMGHHDHPEHTGCRPHVYTICR